ncbi:MAG: Stp1/IreP family PP2C-type Ser/Thr phosphatase [Proteobacteria bacterium]|jgi:serine/threonine protein phosphatase PrpC|nr:Stp1/IreP family PP2C-type Ser/Thr phosphatase [Pseudomonadota bacterium]MDA1300814.1 Stp1/IreP family PP2C-type Ser/Thr phosphatase [Pseudomonadota bacterium]
MNLKGKLQIVSRTDVGQVRDHNEDYISENDRFGVVVLADGMGGLNAGEVASSMSVHLLMDELVAYCAGDSLLEAEAQGAGDDLPLAAKVVRLAVEKANDAVFHVSQTQPQCRGMGTTIVASLFYNNRVSVAHIGDSRMYRYRNETLEQMTKDHSFVQELIDKGLFTKEEARDSSRKNVVTRALGVAPYVEVEVHEYPVEVNDIYLICSDGLTDLVTDRDIERSFHELHADLEQLASHLINLANASGGKDNISVMLVSVLRPFPSEGGLLDRIANWFE